MMLYILSIFASIDELSDFAPITKTMSILYFQHTSTAPQTSVVPRQLSTTHHIEDNQVYL